MLGTNIYKCLEKKYLEMFGIQTFNMFNAIGYQVTQIAMCLHILLKVCTYVWNGVNGAIMI